MWRVAKKRLSELKEVDAAEIEVPALSTSTKTRTKDDRLRGLKAFMAKQRLTDLHNENVTKVVSAIISTGAEKRGTKRKVRIHAMNLVVQS